MSEFIIECDYDYDDGWIPGEHREEIVRCRDCKHYREHEFVLITDVSDVCLFWAEGVKVAPDGFCAWGERLKEDGDGNLAGNARENV